MTTLEDTIGYHFQNQDLLERALTHKSYYNEKQGQCAGHNERLEFLGDAVLDLVLSDFLMREFPEMNEGVLSKMRARLVNEELLSELALDFSFNELMRLGRGELRTHGHQKPRLLASVFEAFIGAFYLDAGFEHARQFIERLFRNRVKKLNTNWYLAGDYKTRLQELTQQKYQKAPSYKVSREEGPDHDKTFFIEIVLGNNVVALGQGKSKKQAEQNAARSALETL